jgi:hypothetical protein
VVILPALENLVALRVTLPLAFLLRQRMWISFGDRKMSGEMSNYYRLGYYLIFWGVLLTFL